VFVFSGLCLFWPGQMAKSDTHYFFFLTSLGFLAFFTSPSAVVCRRAVPHLVFPTWYRFFLFPPTSVLFAFLLPTRPFFPAFDVSFLWSVRDFGFLPFFSVLPFCHRGPPLFYPFLLSPPTQARPSRRTPGRGSRFVSVKPVWVERPWFTDALFFYAVTV